MYNYSNKNITLEYTHRTTRFSANNGLITSFISSSIRLVLLYCIRYLYLVGERDKTLAMYYFYIDKDPYSFLDSQIDCPYLAT